MEQQGFPKKYAPLSAWAYFGLSVLYAIPFIGFIFLLIHTFSDSNVNRRSFARSYWCKALVLFILVLTLYGIAYATGNQQVFQDALNQQFSQAGFSSFPGSSQKTSYSSYDSIFAQYSSKLRFAVPQLIEEYSTEARSISDDVTALAALCTAKTEKLADIANEGMQEMATYMATAGKGDQAEYESWTQKLLSVYNEEAAKINDAYIQSVSANSD